MSTITIKEVGSFQQLLKTVLGAIDNKAQNELLTGVLVQAKGDEVELIATNGDKTIRCTGKDVSQTKSEVAFLVHAKTFFELLKKLPKEEITIDIKKTKITLTVKKNKYDLSKMDESSFPILQTEEFDTSFEVLANKFVAGLNATLYAVSESANRPILGGVHMEGKGEGEVVFTATDSHRLSSYGIKLNEEQEAFDGIVIPGKAVEELIKTFSPLDEKSITIQFSRNNVQISSESILFASRLLEGTFPRTEGLIPKEFSTSCKVHKEELAASLKRLLVMLEATKDKIICLTLNSESTLPILQMEGKTELAKAHEELFIKDASGDIQLKLSVKYMLDAIGAIPGKEVIIKFLDPMKPIVLYPSEDDTSSVDLLLPVR
ncbi:DNA polymerase III subunit beta [Bacillus sp. SCS-151]|uniref:DNA polymerase III subunit beta n=1 Tax=Nanhaiella sioensis TaxID=3115293 RepID=UPI003979F7A4